MVMGVTTSCTLLRPLWPPSCSLFHPHTYTLDSTRRIDLMVLVRLRALSFSLSLSWIAIISNCHSSKWKQVYRISLEYCNRHEPSSNVWMSEWVCVCVCVCVCLWEDRLQANRMVVMIVIIISLVRSCSSFQMIGPNRGSNSMLLKCWPSCVCVSFVAIVALSLSLSLLLASFPLFSSLIRFATCSLVRFFSSRYSCESCRTRIC